MPSLLETLKYAFVQSDSVGKSIVVLLAVFSAWAWMIIFCKASDILRMRAGCRKFSRVYTRVKSPIGVGQQLADLTGPLKDICAAGIGELFEICRIGQESQALFYRYCQLPRSLSEKEIEKIRSTMNSQVNQQIVALESDLGILGTLVTVSPFLGLFGTVWGVMATFIAISLTGRPDLSAIAPGISGALLTTVAGLVVAIPALVANNLYNNLVQTTCLEMDNFVTDFIASLQLEETVKPSAKPVAARETSPAATTAEA